MSGPQVRLPEGISALGPDAEKRIQALVAAAHGQQGRELGEALEHTMRIVPRPLRGIVRKAVGL